jgi:hypothetical protein
MIDTGLLEETIRKYHGTSPIRINITYRTQAYTFFAQLAKDYSFFKTSKYNWNKELELS